jgi:predicted MFS family arabinose efflux permease
VRVHGAAAWGGVFALALSAFVLVASEFMPVSLLTQVATDLHVTEGQAGQSIAVSGAFALVTSLLISSLARGIDRKKLLLGLTLLMAISGTIAAFAPNYTMFMIGRAFIGIAIGGFWSMSAAVAMRLVPTDQVSKALAIVNGGNALATVVAAPLGSFLAAMVGWRGAFFFLIPVAIIALAWKLISLPAMPAGQPGRKNNLLGLLKRRPVVLGMAAVSVFFMGQFTLFTYLRPFLEAVTRTSASMTSFLLLIIGVAGFVGTILIGPGADRVRRLAGDHRGAAGLLGPAGDLGAGRLVDLAGPHAARRCRSRRRPAGCGRPARDRHRGGGRRHAVRPVRLPRHLRRKRGHPDRGGSACHVRG